MDDLRFLSAIELGALLSERQLSATELVEATLRRIEALEPRLGAFVAVDGERALAQAAAVEPGDRRLFAGVPTAVKANTQATGLPFDYGTALLRGNLADHDAHLVRRLRDQGFVLTGATKTPEFGILPTTEPRAYGPARNPWKPDRTPGGSSGGAAAAVAAGMVPVAHGNDGGGSIRIPAACCGLVGLKPSRGRVSRGPDSGDSVLVADGVLSRTVLDSAAALDVLAGYEAGDATWAPPPDVAYTTAVNRDPGTLRVHVVTDNPFGDAPDPENAVAVSAMAETLADLGHEVEHPSAALPGPETLPLFLTLFGANIALSAAHAQLIAGRPPAAGELEPLSEAMIARAAATNATEYLGTLAMLQALSRRVIGLFADCDVMLTPALAQRPPIIGTLTGFGEGDPMDAFERAVAFAPYAGLFNVTGQPAITVPAGLGADGLPSAVQIVGRPLGEDTLLAARAPARDRAALGAAHAAGLSTCAMGSGVTPSASASAVPRCGEHRRAERVRLVASGQSDGAGQRLVDVQRPQQGPVGTVTSRRSRPPARSARETASRAVIASGPAISATSGPVASVASTHAATSSAQMGCTRAVPMVAGDRDDGEQSEQVEQPQLGVAGRVDQRATQDRRVEGESATARSASALVRCTRERWCAEAPSGLRKMNRCAPASLGGPQQPPGADSVDLLDRRVRLVALGGREVHDGRDAAHGVAEGGGVSEIADRDLDADALGAETARVAHEAAHRLAAGDEATQQRRSHPSCRSGQQQHATADYSARELWPT